MASQSKGKNKRTVIERPGINWRENSQEGSSLILSVVKEAAMLAPIAELKKAACSALLIFKTTQIVKENKEAYERLGYDSGGLIIAIWRSFKKAEDPEKWLSAEMRDILEDLSHTLENICSFVNEQLSKSKAIRVIFSRADGVKINEYREHLNYAMQKFELQSHMNINDVLIRVLKKNDEISEQILHRNEEEDEVKLTLEIKAREARDREIAEKFQDEEWEISKLEQLKQVEINRQTEDEQWQSDELKKIEKETKNRKSELERLRAAARELQEANQLMEAEEEEIAQLKQALGAKEDNRGSSKTRGRSSEKKSSRQEDKVYEEDDDEWEGNFIVEEASSEEELEQPVRRGSNTKRNVSGSPKRRLVPVDSTDDEGEDLQSLRSSRSSRLRTSRRNLSSASLPEEDFKSSRSAKARMARRNLSSASLHVQDTEDDYTDEEDDYAPLPPRKSSKSKRKPQTPSGNVDDLMAQFQGFMPMGMGSPRRSGSNSRSGSPIYIGGNPYIPNYGGSPIGPYGYGLPGTIVNSGVGNIVNSSISNVGNDNSVRKVYRPRSQRRE